MFLTAGCHPLDPLTPEEIKAAAGAIKAKAAEKELPNLRFNVITLAVSPSPHSLWLTASHMHEPRLQALLRSTSIVFCQRVPGSRATGHSWYSAMYYCQHIFCALPSCLDHSLVQCYCTCQCVKFSLSQKNTLT